MLTDHSYREVTNLVNQLSADLTVLPQEIVNVIKYDDEIYALVSAWLKGRAIPYADLVSAFNEVF